MDSTRHSYEEIWAAGVLPIGEPLNLCIGQIPVKRADTSTLASTIAKRLIGLGIGLSAEHKIAYFVGDSAQVNSAMVDAFNDKTDGASHFIPCAAHMLNNMIQAVWSAVRPSVRHLLAVIENVRNRGDFRRLAEEMQLQRKLLSEHKRVGLTTIATAISVRWYSRLKMLKSSIELRSVIETYLDICGDGKLKKRLMKTYAAQSEELNEEVPALPVAEQIAIHEPSTHEGIDEYGGDQDRLLGSDGITPPAFVIEAASSQHSQGGIGIEERE
jgi:hypothetical protein